MDFFIFLVCKSNGPIYFNQNFNGLDKLVVKLKNTCKNNIYFYIAKSCKLIFFILFFLC